MLIIAIEPSDYSAPKLYIFERGKTSSEDIARIWKENRCRLWAYQEPGGEPFREWDWEDRDDRRDFVCWFESQ